MTYSIWFLIFPYESFYVKIISYEHCTFLGTVERLFSEGGNVLDEKWLISKNVNRLMFSREAMRKLKCNYWSCHSFSFYLAVIQISLAENILFKCFYRNLVFSVFNCIGTDALPMSPTTWQWSKSHDLKVLKYFL